MKKGKLLILLFSALLIAGNLFSIQSREDMGKQVAKTYMSQVGVTELTGNNDGIMVEKYQASAGIRKGDPWCAAFVNWCFEQNGIEGPKKLPGYSPSWFPENAKPTPSPSKEGSLKPQQADVFGIYYASKGRIAHVGFIDRWQGKYAITVEGNTNDEGSREGGSVLIKRRLTRQISYTSDWISIAKHG